MKLILLLAWRHLAFRPGKTLASVLGIAVGIATVVSVMTIDHNTLLTQYNRRVPSDPDTDLLLQPHMNFGAELGGPSVLDVEAVRRDLLDQPFLDGVAAHVSGKYALQVNGKTVAGVELMGVEQEAASFHGAYLVDAGEDLDYDSEAPQLLMTSALAEERGLVVGDLVVLTQPPRRRAPVTRCVGGEYVIIEERVPSGARAGGMGAGGMGGRAAEPPPPQHQMQVVGLLAATQLGYSKNRVITTYRGALDMLGPTTVPLFWADFDRSQKDFLGVEAELRDRFVVIEPKRALAGEAPEEMAFRSGVRFCGFLALFLGLYIIFNTMSMSLVERVRYIGLMRALGVTRGRLLLIFMAEGGLLSIVGAGASLLLADGIVGAMASRGISTLGVGKGITVTEWPWGEILGVLVLGVCFCLLGVLYPFLRAARLSVIDALRRGVIELSADPFTGARRTVLLGMLALVPIAWFVGTPPGTALPEPMFEAILQALGLVGGTFALLLLFPKVLPRLAAAITSPFKGPEARLARSTMSSSRHRVFGSVSGLMLVFSAVFLIVSVLESLKSETRQFGETALAQRLFIKVSPDGAERMGELRRALPELGTLVPLNVEVYSPFLVRGVDKRILGMGSLAGDENRRLLFETRPSIVVSTRCSDDFGYATGDWVTLNTAAEGPVAFRVLAVTDEYGFAPDDRVFGVISAENMRRYWCLDAEGLGNYFSAFTPKLSGVDLTALEVRIAEVLGEDAVLDIRRGEDIAEDYVGDLQRSFAIFYVILLLTVVLAAVGILNAMVIAVMERRREIGLLRSVGLTAGQVAGMLLLESGTFGVLGGLLGVALGVPLAVLTTDALTQMSHLELSFQLSPRTMGAVLGGAVVVAVLAVILPVLRANRLRLSEVMRYE